MRIQALIVPWFIFAVADNNTVSLPKYKSTNFHHCEAMDVRSKCKNDLE